MVDFDEKGWFVGQVVKTKINHEDDHNRLYYESDPILEYDKSEYVTHTHNSHKYPNNIISKTIPFYQVKYRGKKFEEWHKKGSGALAVITSKSVSSNKIVIVKILIPKQVETNKEEV